jgi:formate dehydrogenase major subunit
MNIEVSRRHFMKLAGAGAAGSAIAAFGFGEAEAQLAAHVRPFKLAQTKEARSTCPYCSVSCGMLIYSAASKTEKGKMEVVHIEGDVDNPVNRGTLCPKGAAAIDFVKSETRVKYPMHRKPGTNKFERVSWDFAMDRIAKLMKEDRDANFIDKNKDGVAVNRWPTMGFLSGCATSNETGWVTYKLTRGLGIVQLENQARI